MIAYLGFVLGRIALAILQAFPLPWVRSLGRFMGALGWRLDLPHRRLSLRNVGIAFEEKGLAEREKIARQSFARFVENMLMAAWMAPRPNANLKGMFEISGVEQNLKPALAKGKGAVIVLFHYGNWEALSRVAADLPDLQFSAIYQPLRNLHFDRLIRQWREAGGLSLINRRQGFKEAIARLRKGEAVGLLADQHAGDHGLWTPFFGRLGSTTTLPALLAKRTGATIVPLFCLRAKEKTEGKAQLGRDETEDLKIKNPSCRWRVEFGLPIKTEGCSDGEIMMEIHRRLEEAVRDDPAAWFWAHDRWKTPSPNFLLKNYRRGIYVPPRCKLKPFKILVRGVNWLGDSILTIPALRAVKEGRPDAEVHLLAPPKLADLWKSQSFVDGVFTSYKECAGKRYDAAILFPNSLRSSLEIWRLGIPRRQGYAGHFRRWLLTAICPESFRGGLRRHDVHDFNGLARWSGAEVNCEVPKLEISAPVACRLSPVTSYIVLHPGAAYGSAKRWLPERFVELVKKFPEQHWKLIGNLEEKDRNSRLAAQMGAHVEDWTGRLTLPELANVLQGAQAVVCNDSGPMHLAAAVGARVVAIFGSTEPLHTGPLGEGHRVIRHRVECSPCYLRDCPIDLRCMKAIGVDEVANALKEVLDGMA